MNCNGTHMLMALHMKGNGMVLIIPEKVNTRILMGISMKDHL